jgi:hypothetical protein
MQLSINTSVQQTQLDFSQISLKQSATGGIPLPTVPQQQDRIELSDEARRPRDRGHSIEQALKTEHDRNENPLYEFLRDIIEQITGVQIHNLRQAPFKSTSDAQAVQEQQSSISARQASLSFESSSLSIGGSITTSDGTKLSFALDLQIMHASASTSAFTLNSGHDGYDFTFAGSAAELNSTSFSFSLTAETADSTPAIGSGLGVFSLKDDLKEISHALKPLVKDFMKEAGIHSSNDNLSKLLSTIA